MKVSIDGINYVPEIEVPKDGSMLSALEVRFDSDAGENLTVREYLHDLLQKLWLEDEGFNSKRPWGNSGWYIDILHALVKSGHVRGTVEYFDDEEEVEVENMVDAGRYVSGLISLMCFGNKT